MNAVYVFFAVYALLGAFVFSDATTYEQEDQESPCTR